MDYPWVFLIINLISLNILKNEQDQFDFIDAEIVGSQIVYLQ